MRHNVLGRNTPGVALFRPKADCPSCGASVRQPKDPQDFACPECGKPGPWATDEQRAGWSKAEEERERLEAEAAELERQAVIAAFEARRQQLIEASALKPILEAGFVTQKSEELYLVMPAKLAEWKKQRGRYEGGPGVRGVSVKIPGTSARAYYGGMSQREYVPGAEGWTLVDDGSVLITNKRIVFKGGSKNVEFAFAKLVSVDADESNGSLVIAVTNRQRSHVVQVDDLELWAAVYEAALRQHQGLPPQSPDEIARMAPDRPDT